jgi:hypothetical protein
MFFYFSWRYRPIQERPTTCQNGSLEAAGASAIRCNSSIDGTIRYGITRTSTGSAATFHMLRVDPTGTDISSLTGPPNADALSVKPKRSKHLHTQAPACQNVMISGRAVSTDGLHRQIDGPRQSALKSPVACLPGLHDRVATDQLNGEETDNHAGHECCGRTGLFPPLPP